MTFAEGCYIFFTPDESEELVMVFQYLGISIFLLLASLHPTLSWPTLSANSSFEVVPTDDPLCQVPADTAASLKASGFVRVACPFGVLVAGTATYPTEYLQYGAAVLANILDRDDDGVADDPSVLGHLTYLGKRRGGAMLACGTSRAEEEKEEQVRGFDYTFSCQTHHVSDQSGPVALRTFKAIMQEEVWSLILNTSIVL